MHTGEERTEYGRVTMHDDGQLEYESDIVRDITANTVSRFGAAKAFAWFSYWGNGDGTAAPSSSRTAVLRGLILGTCERETVSDVAKCCVAKSQIIGGVGGFRQVSDMPESLQR
jgi:hypothetical protein